MKKKNVNAYVLTFVGVMAAMVYVVTLFRFPLLGSKVHFANAVCLLAGMLIWSNIASIDSFATGHAQVQDGKMYIEFDNEQIARNVQSGMIVMSGETQSRISSVGVDSRGKIFALAPTELSDGYYVVDVLFKQTQVIQLLFN